MFQLLCQFNSDRVLSITALGSRYPDDFLFTKQYFISSALQLCSAEKNIPPLGIAFVVQFA